VLAYIRCAMEPLTRDERAEQARAIIGTQYGDKQRTFLTFVLAQYVKTGVEELDEEKLGALLRLRYNNSINDALTDLGSAETVRAAFIGFQKYLYTHHAM
jgi:type I restriction enzyme R subunit